ncbi:major capsid protein [Nocardioides zeae]
MPVTLAQAAQNATDAVDVSVINEFRTNQLLDLLTFDDVVNPAGGGATLTYGYRRLATLGTAAFRALNSEYVPSEVTTTKHSVELKVLGGSFQVDRVIAKIGPAASSAVALNMSQKIEAARAEFGDAFINGDMAVDDDEFDGLSKMLTGSTTEVTDDLDWSVAMNETQAYQVLDDLDAFLALLDGEPGAIISNKLALAKIRAALRRTNQYVREVTPLGQTREAYGNIRLVDAGKKAGTNADVIPVGADGTTELYAARFALDGLHGVSTAGGQLVSQWLPDFTKAGAVKTGEVEMGPVAIALKKTKAAGVLRDIKVRPAA